MAGKVNVKVYWTKSKVMSPMGPEGSIANGQLMFW